MAVMPLCSSAAGHIVFSVKPQPGRPTWRAACRRLYAGSAGLHMVDVHVVDAPEPGKFVEHYSMCQTQVTAAAAAKPDL